MLPALATADQGTSDAWRQLEDFERQRGRDELERRQRQLLAPEPASPPQPSDTQGRCEPVQGLRLHGNQLIDEARLRQSAEPYMAACMPAAAINRVLEAITEQYVQAGYIGARPYRLASRELGGPLQVLVVEGQVESIEVTEPGLPLSLGNAFGTLPASRCICLPWNAASTSSTACVCWTWPPTSPPASAPVAPMCASGP
ncbi:POTRA domain-containing protein [Pseudomonas sp. KNUC1026]|uniref:POTRA domain-containing protein n=1 Tax=Pseudomonas sp. KNUC1026 TaxID=2893890 RepID=UPI001F398970|nr:POTRA domain-containing protein [Pseudomonas sp. KNUC1026]UFH48602.1 hypothetical protein LN139_16270 [Pseudomonas sp. KNUC1026]